MLICYHNSRICTKKKKKELFVPKNSCSYFLVFMHHKCCEKHDRIIIGRKKIRNKKQNMTI